MKKLMLIGAALLLVGGCQKAEKPETVREVITQPTQAPAPQLSYRERMARGLLTPEEQREEEALQRIEADIAAGTVDYTPGNRQPEAKAEAEKLRQQGLRNLKYREAERARIVEQRESAERARLQWYYRKERKKSMERDFSNLADRFRRGKITAEQYREGLDWYLKKQKAFEELPHLRGPGRITGREAREAVGILEDARRPPARTE